MLNQLKKLNSKIAFYDVNDPEFLRYGRVIEGADISGVCDAVKALAIPDNGSVYHASEPCLEALESAAALKTALFGQLPAQVGYCYGHNNLLNALEWHTSSEINIAVTPLVLILGMRAELDGNRTDSSSLKAFYVPEGTVIEVYATSLHFCPCEVQKSGFGSVVILPEGTNTPLDGKTDDKYLFAKNKWLIAHDGNSALIGRGAVPGIGGENYRINYQG